MTESTQNRESAETAAAWSMGTPAFLGLFLFLLLPFAMAIVLSFTDQRMLSGNPTEFIGMRNYNRLLGLSVISLDPLTDEETGDIVYDEEGEIEYEPVRDLLLSDAYRGFRQWFTIDAFGQRHVIAAQDPTFYRSLINNFIFALIVVPLQSILALMLAMLINQKDIKGVNIFRTIYFSPVVTSMVVVSVIWTFLYSKEGLINQFLDILSLGLIEPIDWLSDPRSAMVSIIIMSIWQGVGFQMVIFLAGLQGIPEELYEAAQIDGANRWKQFWNVTIPQLRNTIIFVAISTTILAFRLFVQVDVMTKGGPANSTSTVVYHMVVEGFRNQKIGYGASISVVFFIVVLGIALVQQRVLRSQEVV